VIKRIIILKDKKPLINRNYESISKPGEGLGSFQTIVDNLIAKVLPGQRIEEISGEHKLAYELDKSILFLVAADKNEVALLEIFLPELKNLFYAVFPRDYVLGWEGEDTSIFKGFEAKLDQLRSAFENRIMTKAGSRRVLDTLSVMELPQRLQKTAYAILDKKIASFEEIISLTNVSPQEAVANIQEILNAGFLYTTKVGNKVYYSVKAFGEAKPISTAAPSAPLAASITTPATKTAETSTLQPEQRKSLAIKRDIHKGNMPFFIKQFKKDLDKVFNAIINRKPVLVIINPETDKNQVLLNMVLDTLQCFAPERELRIINYAKEFIHPREADIIRIESNLTQYYTNEVILDLDHKKILHGENAVYLADLIKEMTKMKHDECVSLLLNRVTLIEKLAKDWAKIKKLNLPPEEFITNVRAKYNPAIIQVMDNVAENVFMQE